MGEIADEVVRLALQEWETFGRSTRSPEDAWHIVGNESVQPYQAHITRYWEAVNEPERDGASPFPWSGAFISWCFVTANAGDGFTPNARHSSYIDLIRRQEGMSPLLRLRPPSRSLAPGDLIWNAPIDEPPFDHDRAIELLENNVFFASHVDVVVAVRDGECDSVGGNVYPLNPGPGLPPEGGSVVRSSWRLDDQGALADGRKTWIGVVKNGL